jgi:hypothetical protein
MGLNQLSNELSASRPLATACCVLLSIDEWTSSPSDMPHSAFNSSGPKTSITVYNTLLDKSEDAGPMKDTACRRYCFALIK